VLDELVSRLVKRGVPLIRCTLVRALGDQALFDELALADLTEAADGFTF
jgi:hypothetical protein